MKKRIGVVGTGLIGTGLIRLLSVQEDIQISNILTRRNIAEMTSYPMKELLTNSVEELLLNSDLIVECSGDVIYGSEVILRAFSMDLPVVTMNAELQVTTGSYLARKGFITEAEGDQPGCIAALKENVRSMGFTPVVYGNIKGFLNENPSKEDMTYWSKRNGTSLEMTTSFTDGTKVHIEQALVANGLDGNISSKGLLGIEANDSKEGGQKLAEVALSEGLVLSDYILSSKLPPGVFITAIHDHDQHETLRYYKMGEGPYYTLQTNYHLCHFEILKTVRRTLYRGKVLLNNSTHPRVSVSAIAKKKLIPGTIIDRGIGSFEVRGKAVKISTAEDHVPIGLLRGAIIKRPIEAGEMLRFADVDLPSSIALDAWKDTINNLQPIKR